MSDAYACRRQPCPWELGAAAQVDLCTYLLLQVCRGTPLPRRSGIQLSKSRLTTTTKHYAFVTKTACVIPVVTRSCTPQRALGIDTEANGLSHQSLRQTCSPSNFATLYRLLMTAKFSHRTDFSRAQVGQEKGWPTRKLIPKQAITWQASIDQHHSQHMTLAKRECRTSYTNFVREPPLNYENSGS